MILPSTTLLLWTVACKPDPTNILNSQAEQENPSYPQLPDIDTLITEEMAAARVPGLAACIIRDAEIFWCNGYGYANIEEGLPVQYTTPFMIASVSKTFVAEAAMQLAENNQLDLDGSVNSILDFPVLHPEDSTNITTRMLLSHTAGIKDNWSVMNDFIGSGDSPVALGDFLQDYLSENGEHYNANHNFFSSGVTQQTSYSNIGVALAAYVVEVASETSFDSYCAQNIFEPLQMQDTSWHLAGLDEAILAVPYEWRLGDWKPIAHYGYPDYPDGSLRTGAEQLAKFLVMHSNDGRYKDTQIVSPESVAEMNTAQYPSLDSKQGLIWYEWDLNGETIRGHNGGDQGASTEMGVREDGVGFVILMNSDGDDDILVNIEEALLAAADAL
jgi:CubicO group peptidase (beta-lactamase class C family)